MNNLFNQIDFKLQLIYNQIDIFYEISTQIFYISLCEGCQWSRKKIKIPALVWVRFFLYMETKNTFADYNFRCGNYHNFRSCGCI